MSTIDAAPAGRLHALDAVRGGALMLGVAFHASMSFLPGPQIWVVRDASDTAIGGFFFVAHLFRMTLFFLIAGFFARMMLERRGAAGFVRNRLVRIVAPFFAFWPVVFAGIVAALIWGAMTMAAASGAGGPGALPPPPPLGVANFPLTHLWFLYVLTIFYAVALALRGIGTLLDRKGALSTGLIDPAMRALLATPAAAVVLAIPVAVALLRLPVWIAFAGIPTPDTGLIPNATAMAAFGVAFGFGWLLQRQPALLDAILRWWPVHLAVALAATAACLVLLGSVAPFAPVTGDAKPPLAALYALASWSWSLGLLGLALRYLHAERPAVRYVADASYWIYIVHLPVVMAMQVLVFGLALPAAAKMVIVLAGAFLILFASYHLLVRHSWLGGWLNGRKYPWRAAKPAMEMQPA